MTTISDRAALALKAAIATRGPNAGRLKATAPKWGTDAHAAWHGAMLSVNPYKVSIGAMIMMKEEHRAIAHEITTILDSLTKQDRIEFDKDRAALEKLGVW